MDAKPQSGKRLHNTGDERAWWARHGILDPLQMANRLWAASRNKSGEAMPNCPEWPATVRGTDRQDSRGATLVRRALGTPPTSEVWLRSRLRAAKPAQTDLIERCASGEGLRDRA